MCGAVGSRIVIAGGTNWEGGTKNWLRSVHAYDPERRAWTELREFDDGPMAYAIAFPGTGGFGFIGGSDGTKALKMLATVDGAGIRLQPVPDLPPALVLSAGGAVAGKYVIVGGTDDAANVAGVQRSTHLVEGMGEHWKVTRMADFPGKGIAVAASAVIGGELFVFGGMEWDEAAQEVRNRTDAHAFSTAQNSWRPLQSLPTAVRGLTGLPLDGQHIYLAGGFTDTFTAEAFLYDVKADTCRPAPALPYAAMVSFVQCDGFVYCLGGEDKMKSRSDKFHRIRTAELLK